MSVHQTPDGRWFVFYHKGFNKEEPNRTREYFGRGPGGELAATARNRELGLGKRVSSNDGEPTFAELAVEYCKAKAAGMSAGGRADLGYKLDSNILPAIGHLPASRVTPEVLDDYVATRAASGIKMTSIHRELSVVRAVLRLALKRQKITFNPMEWFTLPTKDDAIIAPPSASELSALYRCAAPHLKRAIMLAYYTGMRVGASELLALRWEHVDLANSQIFVESAKKGGMRSRMVPISEALDELLRDWLKQDKEQGWGYGWVVHYRGRRVGRIRIAWRQAKERAGITRRLRPYDLRHMAATDMLASGADLKSVSEILGHSSPDMTLRTYQHTITAQRRAAVEFLGKRLPDYQEK